MRPESNRRVFMDEGKLHFFLITDLVCFAMSYMITTWDRNVTV